MSQNIFFNSILSIFFAFFIDRLSEEFALKAQVKTPSASSTSVKSKPIENKANRKQRKSKYMCECVCVCQVSAGNSN